MALLITFLLGLFIVAGALIAHFVPNRETIEDFSIALALGTMAALVFSDLLPEAIEHLEGAYTVPVLIACIVAGIAILKVLDHFIPDHDGGFTEGHDCSEENYAHIGIITTVAVTLHNLIEGMAVFSIASESTEAGLLVALGVGLHNIPMGIVIASTLAPEKRPKRLGFLAAASLSTFVGGVVMALAWVAISDFAIGILIALTLGMIAYIVLFELLPHIFHKKRFVLSGSAAALGVAIVLLSLLIGE